MSRSSLALLGLSLAFLLGAACGGGSLTAHTDGLDVGVLPVAIQTDYALFSDRCSRCHSLARPLNSGIDSNEYWDIYVERMRRMPGSGISVDDTHGILRFLYYYAEVQRRKKSSRRDVPVSRGPQAVAFGRGANVANGSEAEHPE